MVFDFLPSLIRLKSVNDAELYSKEKQVHHIKSSTLPDNFNTWTDELTRSPVTSLWQTQLALETSLYIWLVNKLEKKST